MHPYTDTHTYKKLPIFGLKWEKFSVFNVFLKLSTNAICSMDGTDTKIYALAPDVPKNRQKFMQLN